MTKGAGATIPAVTQPRGRRGCSPATQPRGQTLGPINVNSGRGAGSWAPWEPPHTHSGLADCQNLPSAAICGAPGSRCLVRKIRFGSAGLHRNARPSLLQGKERNESFRPMLKQLLRGPGWVGKGSASSEIARGADRGGERGDAGCGMGGCGDPRSGAQPPAAAHRPAAGHAASSVPTYAHIDTHTPLNIEFLKRKTSFSPCPVAGFH